MAVTKHKTQDTCLSGRQARHKTQDKLGRVGVLMGGPSTEREISLKSGKAVFENLRQLGLDAIAIDIKTSNTSENIRLISSHKIDCAFIALHGLFGEDGQIQEILDGLNIPYTGSRMLASRLAMDKIATRKICQIHGLPVPKYHILDRFSYSTNWELPENFSLPLVVKPATHGSSIGLSIIDDKKDIDKAISLAFGFDGIILIEEYIKGREVTVGILDKIALPVIEIIPKKRFFDFEAKYQPGMTEYIVPARLEEEISRKIQETAMKVHKLLGCVGCSRVDMILDNANNPVVLELNSIPGFTPTSLLPKAAKVAGIDFPQLCLRLLELAYKK
jgi:D-alanine-D-alanine ligase